MHVLLFLHSTNTDWNNKPETIDTSYNYATKESNRYCRKILFLSFTIQSESTVKELGRRRRMIPPRKVYVLSLSGKTITVTS